MGRPRLVSVPMIAVGASVSCSVLNLGGRFAVAMVLVTLKGLVIATLGTWAHRVMRVAQCSVAVCVTTRAVVP